MLIYISSIIYPLYIAYLLLINKQSKVINLYNDLSLNFNYDNKLLALSFLMVTLVTNLYAISQQRKLEVFIGSSYSFVSLICLFAADFISLLISLELMMVLAGVLIFYGHHKNSAIKARQYFLTHLLSGSLILIGISYIITIRSNTQLISLTDLIESNNNNVIFYILLLAGCLINVAVPPFSGWMVNCYPSASPSAFIYLISFTSKISIIIILKLFSGLEILKLFGILMIIYSGFYACIEDNIKRVICYLAISQLGFMLIAIGTKGQGMASGIVLFLFVHIIYKALFSLYVAVISEQNEIENRRFEYCSEIKAVAGINNPLFSISLGLSLLLMISSPFLSSFNLKNFIIEGLNKDISYYAVLFLKIITCIAILSLVKPHQIVNRFASRLHILSKISLSIMLFLTVIISFWLQEFCKLCNLPYALEGLSPDLQDITQQLAIIFVSLLVVIVLRPIWSRYSTANFNLDLFSIVENIIANIYFRYHRQGINHEQHQSIGNNDTIFHNIEKIVIHKIKSLHNQSASLFIVMSLLITFSILLVL